MSYNSSRRKAELASSTETNPEFSVCTVFNGAVSVLVTEIVVLVVVCKGYTHEVEEEEEATSTSLCCVFRYVRKGRERVAERDREGHRIPNDLFSIRPHIQSKQEPT